MIKIIRSDDCGNSPKNKLLEDVEIALAQKDTAFLLGVLAPDICWRIIGQATAHGTAEFLEVLAGTFQASEITEIAIHHALNHGKAGSVNGWRKHHNGKVYEFCTVYEFSNAKGTGIKEMTHYAIESNEVPR